MENLYVISSHWADNVKIKIDAATGDDVLPQKTTETEKVITSSIEASSPLEGQIYQQALMDPDVAILPKQLFVMMLLWIAEVFNRFYQ